MIDMFAHLAADLKPDLGEHLADHTVRLLLHVITELPQEGGGGERPFESLKHSQKDPGHVTH
jgi:hypothetical protein